MKKTLVISAVLIFFSLAPHVFAQGFVPLATIEGLTKGVTADTAGLATFFNNLYKFAIGMATVLAVIMIIWGGIEYSWQDIPGAKSNGKERIQQAILGLVLVLSPVLVFSIINPSILNLSINLPKLDTKSGPPGGGSFSPSQVKGSPQDVLPRCDRNIPKSQWGKACTVEKAIGDVGEGPYVTPPPGSFCYLLETPLSGGADAGSKYMCSTQPRCFTLLLDPSILKSEFKPAANVTGCTAYY